MHEDLTEKIIGAGMNVHSALGPGLLESTYNACLQYEFASIGLEFERQVKLPVVYRGIQLDEGYRIDFLVENTVIVELKAVEKLEENGVPLCPLRPLWWIF
jgi:GxxExxY protein